MRTRRWAIVLIVAVALAGVYFNRVALIETWLTARVPTSIDIGQVETNVRDSSLVLRDLQIERPNGSVITIDRVTAELEPKSILSSDLVVNKLDVRGVRIPIADEARLRPTLPRLSSSGATNVPVPDLHVWAEPILQDLLSTTQRDQQAFQSVLDELRARIEHLHVDLDELLKSNPSVLKDRQQSHARTREYHALKQRLAEARIQVRDGVKDQDKKWEQLPKRALDRLDRKASSSLPQIDREIEQEATLFAKQLDRMVLPYCNLVAEMMRTAFASDRRTTLVRRGDISGVVCSDVGSKWEIPFDCQVSQWTWEESARIPTIAVWTFHPNSTAIFQIHVERKFANTPESEEGSFLHMVCLWNVDASSSMEIDEYNRERLVRIVAPLSPDEMELPEDRAPLPKLELSYRHLNRMTGPGGQPAIPISFETVAIEPRSLFEIEKTLRDRQQKWLNRVHSEATQVVERLCSTRLASMLDERSHRSASWLEQLSKLDSELMGWQKRWDASEVQPQFRVGNRLAGHPDAYLLPQQSHSNTARKIPSDERTFR